MSANKHANDEHSPLPFLPSGVNNGQEGRGSFNLDYCIILNTQKKQIAPTSLALVWCSFKIGAREVIKFIG